MSDTATAMTNQALRPFVAERYPAAHALAIRAVRLLRAARAPERRPPMDLLVLPEPSDAPSLDTLPGANGQVHRLTNRDGFERWCATMKRTAAAVALLAAIRDTMTPRPTCLRVVSAAGIWWTLERRLVAEGASFDGWRVVLNTPDGSGFELRLADDGADDLGAFVPAPAHPAHPWRWDDRQDQAAAAARWWPIIYAPEGVSKDPGDHGTVGSSVPPATVAAVRAALADCTPPGVEVPYVILAFDPASFNPLSPPPYPAPGMPDGTWHNHSKVVPNEKGQLIGVRARLGSARYWQGVAARAEG